VRAHRERVPPALAPAREDTGSNSAQGHRDLFAFALWADDAQQHRMTGA